MWVYLSGGMCILHIKKSGEVKKEIRFPRSEVPNPLEKQQVFLILSHFSRLNSILEDPFLNFMIK